MWALAWNTCCMLQILAFSLLYRLFNLPFAFFLRLRLIRLQELLELDSTTSPKVFVLEVLSCAADSPGEGETISVVLRWVWKL